MQYPLHELASVIRSKNAGPYELTFDVIFKDAEVYEKIRQTRPFTAASFAELYKIDQSDVLNVVYFDPAKAVKITIKRPMASGMLGESDVYGAQQHAPLVDMPVTV